LLLFIVYVVFVLYLTIFVTVIDCFVIVLMSLIVYFTLQSTAACCTLHVASVNIVLRTGQLVARAYCNTQWRLKLLK